MRLYRGVVKVPLKYIYLFLIVLMSALFMYHEISKFHAKKEEALCRITPRKAKKQKSEEEAKTRPLHPVCTREPEVTRYTDCPSCFRPSLHNISRMLHTVKYSTSMFPRGPPDLFKPREAVQQELITDYLITPDNVCFNRCPYLIAVQISVTDNTEQRDAIRATWASAAKTRLWPYAHLNADIQIVFVLAHQTALSNIRGKPHVVETFVEEERYPTVREWARIREEADRYGDILYLNMQDSYYNLTLKLLSGFKWLSTHCQSTRFFLKVDSDTFVNVPLLLDLLIYNEARLDFSVTGHVYTGERLVHRANRWAVDPKLYPPPLFPVYASACAYIMSANVLFRITQVAEYLPLTLISNKLGYIEDDSSFVSGIMGIIISYDYFTAEGLFTDMNDTTWYMCDIIYDRKVIGKVPDDGTSMYKVWRSFFRYYGKCWKEIPELANPKQQ